MLSIRNLTKSYKTANGRHYVFKDVSLDFPENANIGILGPNGSGKSTLLRILGGIDYPDSGSIRCDKSMSWPLGLRGGFVGNLTGRDNCRMICNIYGLKPREINRKLEAIKELSGIGNYFEEPVKYYSSGMGSRIGFALSMAFDFEILLIDEITAVGDRHFRETAKQAIDDKRGRSHVIMVSHSMGSIRDFCDVGVLLRDGQLTVYENVEEAVRAYLPQDESKPVRNLKDESVPEIGGQLFSAKEPPDTVNLRKQIAGRMRQIEQALEDNDNVKDEGRMHHFLGISYARLGDFARAFHHQQIALQEHPENFGFHIQYITAAIQQSDLEGAQAALEDALSLWPEKAGLLKLLSDLQTRQGKRIAAYESILKAAEAEPDHPQIRHAVATSILALEKPDLKKAQEHCLMAITLNPDVPLFYRTLSRILSAQHQYSDAIKARLEANEKTPPGMREKVREDESIQLKGILTQLEKAVELID